MSITTIARRFSLGLKQGEEKGKQEEYDRFWDEFQENGDRISYDGAFAGTCWNNETLKPKYKITPDDGISPSARRAMYMFFHCGRTNPEFIDYSMFADKIDLSKALVCTSLFHGAKMKNIQVDLSSATTLNQAFNGSDGGVESINSIKITNTCTYENLGFSGNTDLKKLIFTDDSEIVVNLGTTATAGTRPMINIDGESIISIVNALSTNTTGKYVTFNATAVANAEEKGEFYPYNTFDEFVASTGKSSNWTITYI